MNRTRAIIEVLNAVAQVEQVNGWLLGIGSVSAVGHSSGSCLDLVVLMALLHLCEHLDQRLGSKQHLK